LVTGDIHRSRILRYPTHAQVGYEVTELITSPMHDSIIEAANAPHPDLVRDMGAPNSFLLLTADTTGETATLDARFLNAAGSELHRVRFGTKELSGAPYARADLPPLLEFLDGRPVRTRDEWDDRHDEIRYLLTKYFIGTYPKVAPAIREARVEAEDRRPDGSVRRRVKLTLDTPGRVSFEIAVWIPPGEGPFPVLLTQPRTYQIPWAEDALRRGYLVGLYPGVDSHHREKDYPGYESVWETIRQEYPDASWTEISTKAWIASRTLDHLLDRESGYNVVAGRVGIIGFSRYGKQSLIAAAFDERITAVVARSPGSPGSCPYRFTARNTCAEAPADFPGLWFLPSLRSFTGREHQLPIDAHGWLALIAPRRCLIHTAHNDGSEPTFAVERAYREARKVYRFLGHPENLRVQYRTGQHGPITDEHRRQNLDWFDLSFSRGEVGQGAFPEELLHNFDWEAWKSRQRPEDLRVPFETVEPRDDDDRRNRLRWILGEAPRELEWDGKHAFLTDAESEMMTHDRWQVKGTRRLPVSFGANVRGNVYYNPSVTQAAPAVIWLHPYSYHSGYNEGYGVEGTTVYHRLAREGLVVLAYDQCGFGLRLLEGRDFYERYPRWSRLGRMVHDVQAAVDFLVDRKGRSRGDLPAIDTERIYVLGFSLGGSVGLYATALDERIAGVACFSGFTALRNDNDLEPTGGNRRLWEWHALQPRLGLFHGKEAEIPYDFDDVLSLVAPRPCLVVSAKRDREANHEAVRALVDRARKAWEGRGGAAGLTHQSPDDIGRFQAEQQQAFLEWLARLTR
ncbi:MAG: alpha/beta hydrolase, partial [Planctomycetota bacterium]|nr:alpha/beta hydrolase [Planctomycetota bacterium]